MTRPLARLTLLAGACGAAWAREPACDAEAGAARGEALAQIVMRQSRRPAERHKYSSQALVPDVFLEEHEEVQHGRGFVEHRERLTEEAAVKGRARLQDVLLAVCLVAGMALLDVVRWRYSQECKQEEAAWRALYVSAALLTAIVFVCVLFSAILWHFGGAADAKLWAAAYATEVALELDNVFAWGVLFQLFEVSASSAASAVLLGTYASMAVRAGIAAHVASSVLPHWCGPLSGAFTLLAAAVCFLYTDTSADKLGQRGGPRPGLWAGHPGGYCQSGGARWPRAAEGLCNSTQVFGLALMVVVLDLCFSLDSMRFVTTSDATVRATSVIACVATGRALYFLWQDLLNFLPYVEFGVCGAFGMLGFYHLLHRLQIRSSLFAMSAAVFLLSSLLFSLAMPRYSEAGHSRRSARSRNFLELHGES